MRRVASLGPPRHRARLAALLAALSAALLAGACDIAGSTPSPVPTPRVTRPASSEPAPPSQTDTEWGRIWDALPRGFPAPPGAQPATDTGSGPASARLVVPARRDDVVAFYRADLAARGYVVDIDGPLEDGSVNVNAASDAGCGVQVSVRSMGQADSLATIRYGTACPIG